MFGFPRRCAQCCGCAQHSPRGRATPCWSVLAPCAGPAEDMLLHRKGTQAPNRCCSSQPTAPSLSTLACQAPGAEPSASDPCMGSTGGGTSASLKLLGPGLAGCRDKRLSLRGRGSQLSSSVSNSATRGQSAAAVTVSCHLAGAIGPRQQAKISDATAVVRGGWS